MKLQPRTIELLAPARNAEIAIEAINHGADAVYIGASAFGARASAGNSIEDIAGVVDYAHQFNAKVYATVNTIVYDDELKDVERLIKSLYRVGVDALIVQDMGILRMDIPPIELHASTQCDIRTIAKARFLESLGFAQLVLARELTVNEIKSIYESVDVPLESFVHGALCVSYSGRCQVSQVLKGRSANRGECAQICRLPFDLVDEKNNVLVRNKHLLSLKDLSRIDRISEMLEAGVSSFKIEGRLKDAGYVKNVVASYRQAIDKAIAKSPKKYIRSSVGVSEYMFTPNLYKSFNRSFTHYFFDSRCLGMGERIASIDTPKSQGEFAGTVISSDRNRVKLNSKLNLSNGDGFSYLSANGEYCGFRANRVDGSNIVTFNPVAIKSGTKIYRTFDNTFEGVMQKSSAERRIEIDATLHYANGVLSLNVADKSRDLNVVVGMLVEGLDEARTSQEARQVDVFNKLGNTIYKLGEAKVLPDLFVPSSILTQLRRSAVEQLDKTQRMNYRFAYRKPECQDSVCFTDHLEYSDNVANSLADEVYRSHAVEYIEPAIEVQKNANKDAVVMNTRYCIRKELGACRLRPEKATRLPENLYLRYGNDVLLRVDCDCSKCEMKISIVDKSTK